jgi:choline dehydrogenase
LRPRSRGRIRLRSTYPASAPAIQANYLSAEEDLEVLLSGFELSREIFAQAPFADYDDGELYPGAEVRDRAGRIAYLRRKAETIYHPVGTCRMGSDEAAVVDARLRVHGTRGLRVVDASIMPTLIGGNTNAPTIMIGEKAAELICSE